MAKSQARMEIARANRVEACAVFDLRRTVSFFDAQAYTHRQHQTAPRISLEDPREQARHPGLFAAWLSSFVPTALSRALSARRSKCFRCRNFICWRGMGRRRDRRTFDS